LKIIQKYISKNRSFKKFTPCGIVLHETDNPNDSVEIEYNYFNNNSVNASAHLFVDTESVMQMIPFDEVGWHCGRTGNSKYLGCELCHATTAEKFKKIWDNGIKVIAEIFIDVLNITTVTPDNLPSHAEISLRYRETDHMDPINYFAKYGKSVDMFRADVQKQINKLVEVKQNMFQDDDKISEYAKNAVENIANKKIMIGDTDNNFNPTGAVTRQDFAVVINNLLKYLEK
jgi:N-acetylmuramoyl-L-alanine amidase